MPRPYDPSAEALFHPERADSTLHAADATQRNTLLTECARLAYYRAEASSKDRSRLDQALATVGWHVDSLFSHPITGAYAFGALRHDARAAILSFRGTEATSLRDIATDLIALPAPWTLGPGRVHAGFANAYLSLHADIAAWLGRLGQIPVDVVGHSLGAAMATLAVSAFKTRIRKALALGCPRVGNAAFVDDLAQWPLTRVANCCDLVTRVPPPWLLGYRHTPRLRYIDHQGHLHASPSEAFIVDDRRAGRAVYAQLLRRQPDALGRRDLADHSAINYLRPY